MKQLLAIINPKSGTDNKASMPELIDKIIDKNHFQVDLRWVKEFGDAQRFGQEAVEKNYDGAIAIGGDGTVNGVASALIGSQTAMAVVPCGSGNGLARHLNLPLKVSKALEVINEDRVKEFDYGTLNGQPFVCTCGLGFDAQVAYKFACAGKRGFTTYVKEALSQYISYDGENIELDLDGKIVKEKAFVVACCNAAQYGNNSFIAPHAGMQDGMLDVTVISPFRFYSVPVMGLRLFMGNIDKNHHVRIYRARNIKIVREKAGPMHIDGDPITMPTHLEVNCHSGGIRIFVGAKGENNK